MEVNIIDTIVAKLKKGEIDLGQAKSQFIQLKRVAPTGESLNILQKAAAEGKSKRDMGMIKTKVGGQTVHQRRKRR